VDASFRLACEGAPVFFPNLGDFAGPGTLERHRQYLEVVSPLPIPNVCLVGNHEVGGVEVAQATARHMPEPQLEVLPAGHVPYLGDPERMSELLSTFVRSDA
jgi:pimeloyl-ACP methyl ester carboxylesterase